MRKVTVLQFAIVLAASAVCMALARPIAAEIPPIPPGYETPDDAKNAVLSGKVAMSVLNPPTPDNVKITRGIEYGKGGDVALKLDLYQPTGVTKPAPAVVWIHGGAWRSGHRAAYHAYCIRCAEAGYVAATVSYRLMNVAPFPAAAEDVKCAIRWVRKNAARLGVDPNRIAAAGGSAGGHLALLAGYASEVAELEGTGGNDGVSSAVQAVVDFYGPADLTTEYAVSNDIVINFLGGKLFKDAPEAYRLASPVTHVTPDDPPTLIFHGTIDRIVSVRQSEMLVDKLKAAGVPHEFDRIEGWPHTMDMAKPISDHCVAMILEFLDTHLGDESSTESVVAED